MGVLGTAGGGSWLPNHGDRWPDGWHSVLTVARGRQRLAALGEEERRKTAKVLRHTRETEGPRKGRATCTGGAAHGGSVSRANRRPTGPGKGRIGGGMKKGRWSYGPFGWREAVGKETRRQRA